MDITKVYSLYQMRGTKCAGCNLGKNFYSDGYRCIRSGFFFHKDCAASTLQINNLYHPQHSLHINVIPENEDVYGECKLCRGNLPKMYYHCSVCDFSIDLVCARKEVVATIEAPKTHEHPLSFLPELIKFTCHICGLLDDRFPYVCNLCDLSFHKVCAESSQEIDYSCHPKHPLKFLTRIPSYTHGKCSMCRNTLHNVFYHCVICNFNVDVDCAKNPPPFTLDHPKSHAHPLILMSQRIFLCNACGLMDDDHNPYVCLQCNFMIHINCVDVPQVIKIYRHDHLIHYKQRLNPGDWKCKVCHQDINWTCGAYSCSKCPGYAIHLRCATRFGIWDKIEREGISEDEIEEKSYEVVEEGVIRHFSHIKHGLKLKVEGGGNDDIMLCKACTYPIFTSPFYICMECDDFILHQKCAYLPKRKIDSFYKLHVRLMSNIKVILCRACQNLSQGFWYFGDHITMDVRCGSICEPFIHESHPLHSLYVNFSTENKFCNVCGEKAAILLRCEECEFCLDIKCSILPKMVRHQNDKDHFLSLCYGEKTSNQYWCDTCEEEVDSEKWFYSCDQCDITFHIRCALGDFKWIKHGIKYKNDGFSIIPNNFMNRPICDSCNSRCQLPSILKHTEFTIEGDWKCRICHKEINWTCGAYNCSKCSGYAIHLRCATKFGIWDGIERESMSEDEIEEKSYEVIEEEVIRHFSHIEHGLKLKVDGDGNDNKMLCKACTYPIFTSSFYDCMECDEFILHQKYAYLPKTKIDAFFKLQVTLCSNIEVILCRTCQSISEGFWYCGDNINMDARCGSISEPYVHESHPLHSLYVSFMIENKFCKFCNACGEKATILLRWEECEFYLDIKCFILPKMVKNQNDKDHFMSLCYGEKTSTRYWCEICEQEVDSKKWFYSCDQCGTTFHIKCAVGDFIWLKPETIIGGGSSGLYIIPNNHITRPICDVCNSCCQFPSNREV